MKDNEKLKKEIAALNVQVDLCTKELLKTKDLDQDIVKNEKRIGFWVRAALRLMAWAVLTFYMVYRIIVPVVAKEPLRLDVNDGYVMGGCILLLLAIEAAKAAAERWIGKKVG